MIGRLLRDKRLWLLAGVIAIVLALRASGLAGLLSIETLRIHRAALTGWVEANMLAAALAYVAIYIAVVAFSVPGALILTLTGGFLFGAVAGTLLTLVSATVGATLVFLFARLIFGDDALGRFGEKGAKLADGIRRNAWSYLLVLRLVPLFPFFLVNLVPAFVGVRLSVYVATTFFGIMPGTSVTSLTGAGLGSVLDQGGQLDLGATLTPEIVGGLLGLAALALAAIPLKNRFAR